MSSITAADLKLGGRLVAACDAIGAGHLHKAAGIFSEIADELNQEALHTTGLLAPDEDDWSAPLPDARVDPRTPYPTIVSMIAQASPADLQSCARGVHSFSTPDIHTGWRQCVACGMVNIAGGAGGPIDLGSGR